MMTRPATAPIGRWGCGQLLAFSAVDGPTAIARDMVARTTADGLEVVAPGRLTLRFTAPVASAEVASDWLVARTAAGVVEAVWLDHAHALLRGPVQVAGADPALAVHGTGDRLLVGAAEGFRPWLLESDPASARRERRAWLDRMCARLPAAVAARPAAVKVLTMMKGQVCAAEGAMACRYTTPDRWPHREAFLWDSAFHALAWRHLDPGFALEQLAAVLHCQQASGFIPHRMGPRGASDISQPPVLAWAAEQVLALHDDRGWLEWAYPRLAAFLAWMAARRMQAEGLMAWLTSSDVHCRCDESGWDNSPRFDQGPSPLAVDLNAFQARECQVMARFAGRLGRAAEATAWLGQAGVLGRRIDDLLWDEERGIYGDRSPGAAAPRPLRTSAGLLPLVTGMAPAARAARLAALLDDPQAFATPVPLPSVAVADLPGLANPGDMWRGPVWININHQVVRGLQAAAQGDAAARLREGTLAAIDRWYGRLGSLFEYYDPHDRLAPPALPRKGPNDPSSCYHQVMHDFGWTASCWLDLACAP